MDKAQFQVAVDAIKSQLDTLVSMVAADGGGTIPPHTEPPPAPPAQVDADGFLLGYRAYGNPPMRIDPKAPSGTPGTVTLPSGRVVSVPRPDKGEMLMGYLTRVVDQCDGDVSRVGLILIGAGGNAGEPSNWPAFAEAFYAPAKGGAPGWPYPK